MKTMKIGCFLRSIALATVATGTMFAPSRAQAVPVNSLATYVTVTVKLADGQEECGKVSGGKMAKVGSVLTLTATPNKGWGFAGWFKAGESALAGAVPVSYASSWKYMVEDRDDQSFVAKFVSEKDDWLEIVDSMADGVYRFGLDDTPQVMVGLDGNPGEYSVPTLTVSGLPSGVKYVKPGPESIIGTFTGKVKEARVYWVTFTAVNKNGYRYSYVQKWVVGGVDPDMRDTDEIGIDWDSEWMRPLSEMQVGKACHARLKPELEKKGVVDLIVSPKRFFGVSFLGTKDDSWSFRGCPTQPGIVIISMKAKMSDGTSKKVSKVVIIRDSGYRYVSIVPATASTGLGSATKSGVYAVGKTISLTAKPLNKSPALKQTLFGGWYFTEEPEQLGNGLVNLHAINCFNALGDCFTESGDWRKPSDKLTFYWDMAEGKKVVDIYAKFITGDEDELELSTDASEYPELSGEHTFFADPDDDSEYEDFYYDVWSWTYPAVTAKNLPPGVALDTKNSCLRADRSKVKPGMVYPNVTLTAKNLSGLTQTVNLTLRIANRRSDLVPQANYDVENGYSLMVGQDVSASDLTLWLDKNFGTGWKVSATGLPAGMSLDGILTDDSGSEMINLGHAPTKAGSYSPVFTLTRGAGKTAETETFSVTINVHDIPAPMVGVFNGLTCFATPNANNPYADIRPESRMVTISSYKDGTVTAKVGKQAFSRNLGHGWQPNEDGSWCYDVYTSAAKDNGNNILYKLHIDATAEEKAIGDYGFTGFISKLTLDAAGNEISSEFVEDGVFYTHQNVLNTDERVAPFVAELAKQTTKTIGFKSAAKDIPGWTSEWARDAYSLNHTNDLKVADVKVKVTTKGVASISGKVDGVAIKASATLYPVYDEDEKSMSFYGLVPTTLGHRTALVQICLAFWPENGEYVFSEKSGVVYVR